MRKWINKLLKWFGLKLVRLSVALCCRCGTTVTEGYMLEEQVWLSIAGKKDTLCLRCAEERLGRAIRLEDFKKGVRINLPFVAGYILGQNDAKAGKWLRGEG